MCRGDCWSRWRPTTRTPWQTGARRPWLTPRRTARRCTNSGSASRHLRRCTLGATPSRMLVTLRAARGHTPIKSSRPSSQRPMAPRSLRGMGRASPPQLCFCATCPTLWTLNGGISTATSGRWWSVPPCSNRKAPRRATDTRPPTQSGEQARSGQTPQSTSSMGVRLRQVMMPRLCRATSRRLPRSTRWCVAGSGLTTMRTTSSTCDN
jgi:hypothetical protein